VEEVIPDGATFVPVRDPRALAGAILAAREMRAPAPPEPRYTLDQHLAGMLEVYERSCAS
jgi:hypothetical protein